MDRYVSDLAPGDVTYNPYLDSYTFLLGFINDPDEDEAEGFFVDIENPSWGWHMELDDLVFTTKLAYDKYTEELEDWLCEGFLI